MELSYPEIIASTRTAIKMTHQVSYASRYEGQPSTRRYGQTLMKFEEADPSTAGIVEILRIQLGIEDGVIIEILSVTRLNGG